MKEKDEMEAIRTTPYPVGWEKSLDLDEMVRYVVHNYHIEKNLVVRTVQRKSIIRMHTHVRVQNSCITHYSRYHMKPL